MLRYATDVNLQLRKLRNGKMSKIGVDTADSRIRNALNVSLKSNEVTNIELIGLLEILKLEIFEDMLHDDDDELDN